MLSKKNTIENEIFAKKQLLILCTVIIIIKCFPDI